MVQKQGDKVESLHDMGVFKWLRRERVTVTTSHVSEIEEVTTEEELTRSTTHVGTIRTEEYKRDLAEFQARRLTPKELPNGDFQTRRHTPKEYPDTNQEDTRRKTPKELPDTPVRSRCGRHSLPSCVCANDNDVTFNQDTKSAAKYKKKTHKRTKSANAEANIPNVQFLFQNQVFMPGNDYAPFTEPIKSKRHSKRYSKSPERLPQKRLNFDGNDESDGPLFFKNNSLPVDIKHFLECSKNGIEEVDGLKAGGDSKLSSRSSSDKIGDDSDDKLWEVMSELKNLDNWADEQLREKSLSTTRSDDIKSDTSVFGLPIASNSNLDIDVDRDRIWNRARWGAVPVRMKKMNGVTLQSTKDVCMEITILRKCRHPNILLLMGLYPDAQGTVHVICENFVDTLYGILHVKCGILSVQTSVNYALDIANALVFLRMQGYIHTELTSASIVITGHDAAKLADFTPCVKLPKALKSVNKTYDVYSKEPEYVNIDNTNTNRPNGLECEPLISQRSSEAYLRSNAVAKPYKSYSDSEFYFWHAPELFAPDEQGLVHPCSKSDVYSLCLVLWECCNASIPWKSYTYEKLKEQYTLWKMGMILPQDGTYPGCLLALLQEGLRVERGERIQLATLQETLQTVKRNVDELEYIIIPARLSKKKSRFSTNTWNITSPTDSDCPNSDRNIQRQPIHDTQESLSESEKDYSDTSKIQSPLYESIKGESCNFTMREKCNNSIYEGSILLKYEHLPEREYSSACSTPISKLKARIKDIGTPNALHRSDSTEYCSILSPKTRFEEDFSRSKDGSSVERSSAKLSRSFTPKSYRPLHIKVPEYNLAEIKSLPKDDSNNRSSYNFDIKNYSLPSTPIARSNKLRKNAWLSGDLNSQPASKGTLRFNVDTTQDVTQKNHSAPEIQQNGGGTSVSSTDKDQSTDIGSSKGYGAGQKTPESDEHCTGVKRIFPPQDFSSPESLDPRDPAHSLSTKSSLDPSGRPHDVLASVNVKPLVAIHERWIYEANKHTTKAVSLPDSFRNTDVRVAGVKPASHCVDPLPKSTSQLNTGAKKSILLKPLRRPLSPNLNINGNHWEQFCQAREAIAKTINTAAQHAERGVVGTWRRERGRWTSSEEIHRSDTKIDQATDTTSIEEYIKEMIRKEVQRILHDISDDISTSSAFRSEEIINKSVANVMESVKNGEDTDQAKKDPMKSFSRLKINGNNKPLLQIVFNRSGENSLQVLDNCVNVTICDNSASGKEKANLSLDETLTEDLQAASLKRCQGFNALQEARSTEDLYIDDDLSTQMQENFGGKVKLIPLHGSLHEILCEKEDECCLIKVKQENGCDTIYFKCDNSDTESRDAIDGCLYDNPSQDTVVFKRSISLIEERIQRIVPKKPKSKLVNKVEAVKVRPKSEVCIQNVDRNFKLFSSSSPCLTSKDAVEVNIENTMNYEDSSSDESMKCHENDDFELLERKIEEDIASLSNCGFLEKISEENLANIDDDTEKVVEE